ncbi:MAG TPA: site-specific integrase [Ktedonobacterales bacterium]|nr:site-specific integrase [Ktedonobacterales bacterium]
MTKRRGHGEGSIRQRPDGLWEARLSLPDGRRKSFYDKSRQVVAKRLSEALRDRDKGAMVIADERLTVERYLADWLERMQPPRIRPSTHRRYGQQMAHVIRAYGDLRLTRLTASHLATLYARLQRPADSAQRALSASSVHHIHVVLREALDDALQLGLVMSNVTDRVDAPKLRRPPIEPFTSEEAQRLLEAACGDRLEALYVLALTTGMRLGELLALTWRQVDLEARTLHVVASLQRVSNDRHGWALSEPKTEHSRRQIALTPSAIEALRAHRVRQLAERLAVADVWQERDLVFCDETGDYLNALRVTSTRFQALLRRAGLPRRRFHDLRHTCATLLFKAGVHPKVVSAMLGHSTIAITLDIYSHALPDMQREAVQAMEAMLKPRARQA